MFLRNQIESLPHSRLKNFDVLELSLSLCSKSKAYFIAQVNTSVQIFTITRKPRTYNLEHVQQIRRILFDQEKFV